MPASRRARAMIFAPRSCPSRPGLAITTLIFRAIGASLRSDPLEREHPVGALDDHPVFGGRVVLVGRRGRRQREPGDAFLRERGNREMQRAGHRPEWSGNDLSGLAWTLDPD